MPDTEVLDEQTGEITIAQEEPKPANAVAVVEPKKAAAKEPEPKTKLGVFYGEMQRQKDELGGILPKHLDVDLFLRILYTAVQLNPKLLEAPRRQLWLAAMMAAQDGLLPDGKEGAIVPRYGKDGISLVWQPMIAGIRKRARQSGEIEDWRVEAVFENDEFHRELGDNPRITHVPPRLGTDRGEMIGCYSICTLKGGFLNREVMDREEIERLRDRSDAYKAFKADKIKSTPWATDFIEMGKKTVARRHSKQLPLSRDLFRIVNRDDALFFENEPPREAITQDEPHRIVKDPLADDLPAEERPKQIEGKPELKPKKEKAPAKPKQEAQEPPPPSEEPAGPGVPASQPAASVGQPAQVVPSGGPPGTQLTGTKELMVNYGKALTRAQSVKSLSALDAQFFAAYTKPTDEASTNILREIFAAHEKRCNGEIDIPAMDRLITAAIGKVFL